MMYSRALRWVLLGAAVAVAFVVAGTVAVAVRRGCALADDETMMFPPDDETLDADPVTPAGSIG